MPLKRCKYFICFTLVLFSVFLSCGISKSTHHKPDLTTYNHTTPIVQKIADSIFTYKADFLLKNKQGLWELYLEGDPLEIGLANGALTDSLLKKQERIFFEKIGDFIPSKSKQKMLRNFLKWYNRKLYRNVLNEYQTEIYGISRYTSPKFDFVAPPFQRSLYLHASHDIGHALQDLALVGCSSFAAWGEKSSTGNLILGRNFDFYVNDAFAKDKIVAFIKPDLGYPFMMVTWAGMIGTVSGMNKEGLTVTINAGKSKIPMVAKAPISIVTREILQYAKNIDEAIAIAKKRSVFVSESIMVGSALDNKAVLIEITPNKMDVFDVANGNQIICTNHFQSEELKNDPRNLDQIRDSHSEYRYERIQELLDENKMVNPKVAAEILRNTDGINDLKLGYGNEKALNQLMAHHGIIFEPTEKRVWVSSNPYQLGEFVCYDLDMIFNTDFESKKQVTSLAIDSLNIPKDPFLETTAYSNYQKFRIENSKMSSYLDTKSPITDAFIQNYQSLNPDYWVVYYKAGLYFYQSKQYALAKVQFEKALTKEITTLPEKARIENYLKKISSK